MKRILMLAAIAVIAPWSFAQGQQPKPNLKPAVSPPSPVVRRELLLEIDYDPNKGPAYCTVDGVDSEPKWIWISQYLRVPGSQPQPSESKIGAVKLEAQFNGETADVRLTLFRGVRGFEKEDLVKSFQVGVDEERTLAELTQFGIQPFKVKLIETIPPIPLPAGINNLTTSVAVERVASLNMPRPAYRITFQNLSDKRILAVSVSTTTNGRPGVSAVFKGKEGHALIEARGVSEQYLMVHTPERLSEARPTSNIINIQSVVFSDLSVEGDVQTACSLESSAMGRRLWLEKVIPFLSQEITRATGHHASAAKEFKERFSALTFEAGESEIQTSVISPKCHKPAAGALLAAQAQSLIFLRDIDRLIETRPSPPVNFQVWLAERRARYQAWLSRL